MASLESQQWYIEEIPPICDVPSEVGAGAVDSSASVDIKLDDAAAKLTALDIDPAALATGTCQGKDTGKSGFTEEAPFGVMKMQARRASGGSWTCKTIASSSSSRPSPVPRGGCSWTKVGCKYFLFGGADAYQQHFADVHCFDQATGTWEKASIGGTPPSARSGHSAIALEKSLVVYGGMNGQDGVTFNDIFELRIGEGTMKWISLPCQDAPPRNSHAAVIHENTMIVIGGASPEGQTDGVYAIDLSDRSSLTCRQVCCKPSQSPPPYSSRLQSKGGTETPAAREMHSACLYGSRTATGVEATVLLMGGRSEDGVLPDLFSLSLGSWEWRRLKDAPAPRCAHSACFVGDSGTMAIHGGWDGGTTVASDLHLYDTQSGDWMTPNISPGPVGRFAHAACTDGGKSLLIFGGVNPGEDLTDVLVLMAP